ncbi:hypothetical protein LJC12_06265, partial [Odoribacter sp. OttesenSCG-928-J03]|nr:hypothetical protein [Odoribacter sp. OttesenSCG-928-J03]
MKQKVSCFFIFLPFFLLFISSNLCGQKAEYREGYHPDGTVRYKGYFIGKEPQGEVTHYYPEGTI